MINVAGISRDWTFKIWIVMMVRWLVRDIWSWGEWAFGLWGPLDATPGP